MQDFVHQPYLRLLGCFDAQGNRVSRVPLKGSVRVTIRDL